MYVTLSARNPIPSVLWCLMSYNFFSPSTVGKLPQFQVPPPAEVIVLERSLKLIPCKAIGSPMPDISWYAEDDPLPLQDNAKYTIYQNGSLLIRNIKKPDALKYKCTAKNLVGKRTAESTVKIACKCLTVKTFQAFILWVVSCNKCKWKFSFFVHLRFHLWSE